MAPRTPEKRDPSETIDGTRVFGLNGMGTNRADLKDSKMGEREESKNSDIRT